MLVELLPLHAGRTVLITVAKVDDKTIRVNVIPTPAQADENLALSTPLTFIDPARGTRRRTRQASGRLCPNPPANHQHAG